MKKLAGVSLMILLVGLGIFFSEKKIRQDKEAMILSDSPVSLESNPEIQLQLQTPLSQEKISPEDSRALSRVEELPLETQRLNNDLIEDLKEKNLGKRLRAIRSISKIKTKHNEALLEEYGKRKDIADIERIAAHGSLYSMTFNKKKKEEALSRLFNFANKSKSPKVRAYALAELKLYSLNNKKITNFLSAY